MLSIVSCVMTIAIVVLAIVILMKIKNCNCKQSAVLVGLGDTTCQQCVGGNVPLIPNGNCPCGTKLGSDGKCYVELNDRESWVGCSSYDNGCVMHNGVCHGCQNPCVP